MRPPVLLSMGIALVLLGGAACGGDDESATSGSGSSGSGGAGPGCSGGAMPAGDHSITLEYGGASRDYILHVPTSADGHSPTALIVNFHGYGSNAAQQELFSAMDASADADGFVVAYPNGIASSWNAGACCGTAATQKIDDVGFARALVADIAAHACIDSKRVYATGMSNGGFMSHRLGCEAADLFAAVAPVSGVLGIPPDQCKPSRPMPLIEFHGTADQIVPYDGSTLLGFPSVPDTFAGWAARDGCTDMPQTTYQNGTALCATYAACKGGVKVTLCTLQGEGHCWPGQSFCPPSLGASTTDISANDAMWTFFGAFALP